MKTTNAEKITFHACGPRQGDEHPDDWMLVGLVDDGAEQRAEIEAADARERLRCDVCLERVERHDDLIASGDEKWCDACAQAIDGTEVEQRAVVK